jgi:4-hydroxybenzoate polyprenyltransferase
MEADDLKKLWGNSKVPRLTINSLSLSKELDKEFKTIERKIARRDLREIIAAIALIPLALARAYFTSPVLAKITLLLIIPYALMVIYKLKQAKKYKVTDMNLDFKESIKRQIIYYCKQRDLLNTVLWWYLLPPAILSMLHLTSLGMVFEKLIFHGMFITILYGAIYALNKRVVRKQLNPLIRKLDDILLELDRGETATEQIEKL